MRKFVKTGCILLSALLITGTCTTKVTDRVDAKTAGINVNYHTEAEIRQYIAENPFDFSASVYDETPNYKSAPYSAGKLSDETLQNALNALNTMRFVAGIDEVELSDDDNLRCQAGALINAVNNTLSHSPTQPDGMSDELYQLGLEGASSSNIGWGYNSLVQNIISGWMEDGDEYNIECLGHRRWCLNPSMEYTGFGNVGSFYSMYAFDNWFADTEYYGVAWPAQVMPVQYFGSNYPWSISMGQEVDISKVSVMIENMSDGEIWTFSEEMSDGYFTVSNEGYGKTGCIIFRPTNIEYKAGDIFNVTITGTETPVSYTVEFFDIEAEEKEYTASDVSAYADFIVGRNEGDEDITDLTGDKKVNVFDVIYIRRSLIQS